MDTGFKDEEETKGSGVQASRETFRDIKRIRTRPRPQDRDTHLQDIWTPGPKTKTKPRE